MIFPRMEINLAIDEGLEGYLGASWLEKLAEKILVAQGADSNVELSLVMVTQERIRQLNRDYLGEDEPTDVLSFSLLPEPSQGSAAPFVLPPDGVQHLGEVIISYPQAVIQAAEHGHSAKKAIALLLTHGVLHLLGYDHDEPARENAMRAREREILSRLEGELK